MTDWMALFVGFIVGVILMEIYLRGWLKWMNPMLKRYDLENQHLRAEIDRLKVENMTILTEAWERIAELENVLGAITDEYEADLIEDYKSKYGNPIHPAMESRLERDLSTVREARDILAKAEA